MIWHGLINDTISQNAINNKLEEIKEAILSNDSKGLSGNLLGGDLGCALFFLYYYKYTKDEKNLLVAENILLKVFEDANNNLHNSLAFSDGLSGICWFTEFSKSHDFLDIDSNEIFSDIDKVLYDFMMYEIKRGNYDYMHGALGTAFYFLEKKSSLDSKKYINKVIHYIEKTSIIETTKNYRRWDYYHLGKKVENCTNFGLSHGIPSILAFLVKCHKKQQKSLKSRKLILDIVNYLMQNIQDPKIHKTYFPYSIDETNIYPHDTRLAWCYGDLSVCCALWQANSVLKDDNLKEKIIEIMIFSTHRKSLSDNMVNDAALCHGTAGIAHIFNRFYHITNIPDFKEAAIYWYNQTIQMSKFEDGLAGYKTCISNDSKKLENCTGFLEGIAGIGLALISSVSDIEPSWDEFLLIS